MGTWTIYSIGDVAFLEQIFIAVAMVTGTSDFPKAASIAFLVAILMYFFQSIMRNAQDFNLGQLFIGWAFFMCMFYPTTTVVLEDGVTGSVRVVSNVPLGMGAVGGITSSIGYGLTTIFEQGYGYIAPGVTESHFADSLALLNKVRKAAADPRLMQAINESLPAGADYRASWDNYIRECTLRKIDLGQTTVDDVLSTPLPEALRFDSGVYGTRLYLYNSSGNNVTCSQGYSELINAQGVTRGSHLEEALGKALNLQQPEYGGANAFNSVFSALQALEMSQQDAYRYIEASILEPIYHDAVLGKYQDMQDFSSAVMINEALQQRNVQWAAEQSMFMSTIRPLQTFFEGLVYALTPLIGVLVVMGTFGISLVGKYFQTMLWIQLWLPTLSIINLYIYTAASGELASYNNEKFASIYSLAGVNDILQNWVGVGAMLAASTPVIALFLVSGSSYAMMGIAGRVSGADHVKEQTTTPDMVQSGAYMANQAQFTNTPMKGAMMTGAEGIVSSASLGSTFSNSVASSQERYSQAQEAFTQSLSRAMSSGTTSAQSLQTATSLGAQINSSNTQEAGYIKSLASDYMKANNISQSERDLVTGAVAMSARAGGGIPGTDTGGGLGATGSKSNEKGSANVFSSVDSYTQGLGLTEGQKSTITDGIASSFDATSSSSFAHSLGDSASKSLQESASQVTAAKEAYTETNQAANAFGAAHNMKFSDLAGLMTGPNATPLGRGALNDLNDYFRSGQAGSTVQQAAINKENQYRSLGFSPAVAQATARMEAMTDGANYNGAKDQLQGVRAASGIMSKALGGINAPSIGGATDNQGIQAPEFNSNQLKDNVKSGVQPAAGLSVPELQNTGRAYGGVGQAFNQGVNNMPMSPVLEHHARQSGNTLANAGSEIQHQLAGNREGYVSSMEENPPVPTSESKFFNSWASMSSNIKEALSNDQNGFDPGNSSGLKEAIGTESNSSQFGNIAQMAKHQLGLPDDQAAYFAYRAMGGSDPKVREAFIGNEINHASERDGAAIANTIERTATSDPNLAAGYLNPLNSYNAGFGQSTEVATTTGIGGGELYRVDMAGTRPEQQPAAAAVADSNPQTGGNPAPAADGYTPTQPYGATPATPGSSEPTLDEAAIRQDESNKHEMQNYWRPNNSTNANNRFDYSQDTSTKPQRPIPKKADQI